MGFRRSLLGKPGGSATIQSARDVLWFSFGLILIAIGLIPLLFRAPGVNDCPACAGDLTAKRMALGQGRGAQPPCNQTASLMESLAMENNNCKKPEQIAVGWLVAREREAYPLPSSTLVFGDDDTCLNIYGAGPENKINERMKVSTYWCMGGHNNNEFFTMDTVAGGLIWSVGEDEKEWCLGVEAGQLAGKPGAAEVAMHSCHKGSVEQTWHLDGHKFFLQGNDGTRFFMKASESPASVLVQMVDVAEAQDFTFVPLELCDRPHNWVQRPSKCTVRGHLIEELDPIHDFRRGVVTGLVNYGEDKTHLLPWLLAAHEDLAAAPRKVLLDLGANAFDTSTKWFLEMYPLTFDEIHAFELNKGMFVKPPPSDRRKRPVSQFGSAALDSIIVHEGFYVSHRDGKNEVNITRFILEDLKLTPADTLVVKMDVETAEWAILGEWVAGGERGGGVTAVDVVDELFVEFHYAELSLKRFNWHTLFASTGKRRADMLEVMMRLRALGVFAHVWP